VKPWDYTPENDPDRFYSVQHQVGEAMRIGALFAQPFMPTKAADMLDILNVKPNNRKLRFAVWGADRTYGVGFKGSAKYTTPQVFPRFPPVEIKDGPMKKSFGDGKKSYRSTVRI
jgi:methionyl-tRNA synthetase